MDGRVALVTGGGSGIGRASATAFAAAGASVVVADLDDEGGAGTVDAIGQAGGRATFVRTDVTNEDAVAALVASAVDTFGGLDYAHNNAGISGAPTGLVGCSRQQWDQTLAVNLTAVWLCMKHEVPAMLDRGGGAVVNTASGAGLVGFAGLPAYVASKHGVVGLTKSAALELVAQGIRVNAVCPGTIRTPMLEAFMGGDENLERMMARSSPVNRLGTPEEIAAAVVWLCSDAASFVNGAALPIDGGAVAQ